jgi:hypothetical protein
MSDSVAIGVQGELLGIHFPVLRIRGEEYSPVSPSGLVSANVQCLAAWYPHKRGPWSLQVGVGYGRLGYVTQASTDVGILVNGKYSPPTDPPSSMPGIVGHVGGGYAWSTRSDPAGHGPLLRLDLGAFRHGEWSVTTIGPSLFYRWMF